MNSDSSPNYIQFNSLYQRLNTARWKARLNQSAQTNLSNLQTQINHSIVIHDFQYPFNLIGNNSTQLIAVTHQFEAWDNQKVQYAVVILIHPYFITQYIHLSHDPAFSLQIILTLFLAFVFLQTGLLRVLTHTDSIVVQILDVIYDVMTTPVYKISECGGVTPNFDISGSPLPFFAFV